MEFKDKNLLIITNSYPNKDNSHYGGGIFVKEQVRYLKDYFNEVYVISPQPGGGSSRSSELCARWGKGVLSKIFPSASETL